MRFKSYDSTLKFLFEQLPMYQRIGAQAFKKDLKNIKALCKSLGQPHQKFNSIHIAGTNGKGSTTHLIASALVAHGLKVGIYTSPHYKDFRERIKVGRMMVPKKFVTDFVNKNIDFIDEIQPSFFEITVAMAFQHFYEQKVDIAVIETGLGGRLDSTNVLDPLLSVITNISMDHQAMLGNTLEAIAKEKAGIIKKGKPVLIGEKQKEVLSIFKKIAKKNHSRFAIAKQYFSNTENLENPFQIKNRNCAASALEILSKEWNGFSLDQRLMIKGFQNVGKNVGFIGRWQLINKVPKIMVDSAHNEAGLSILFQSIQKLKYNRLHIVTGFVNDKSIENNLALFPKSAKYYFTKADIPRGLSALKLKEKAAAFGLNGKNYTSVRKALAAAKMSAKKKDLILITGSIFVVGEVL